MSEAAMLVLNAGSSSIKFGLYKPAQEPEVLVRGQVENIGAQATLSIRAEADGETRKVEIGEADHARGLQRILHETRSLLGAREVAGVGHRIAHGGTDFVSPQWLDDSAIAKLRALSPLAPLHQPFNLAAIDAARDVFPEAVQVGCFDTAFHRSHPWVNDTFALPRTYYDRGVRRYGFHGLSYDYVTGALKERAPDLAAGRIVIAHLGNGASMCAVQGGRSIASTMGFSALDGLPMGTRCGQLDPGVLLYLMQSEGMDADQITRLLYKESGLKGLSGLTHDMRTLEASDAPEAREAIDYFVFRIRREIGAMCAILGGVDAIVFTGGIGENSALVRSRVCSGMDWLGVSINEAANGANAETISCGRTPVLVIATNEERVIARAVTAHLG